MTFWMLYLLIRYIFSSFFVDFSVLATCDISCDYSRQNALSICFAGVLFPSILNCSSPLKAPIIAIELSMLTIVYIVYAIMHARSL